MKKVFIILSFVAFGAICHAQYYRPINVPLWEGPVRAWIGGGLVQRIGTPDFDNQGFEGNINPDVFSSPMNMNLALGVELKSSNEGLNTGPYFHFDFSKDSWTADFSSERPANFSNPINANFIFRYDMTCMHLAGTFGWGAYYNIGDILEVGLGAGLYMLGSLNTQYSFTCIRKADEAVLDNVTDEPWEFGGGTSNPMNIGIEGKFDALYFFAEGLSVGIQLRYDVKPLYSSLDDIKNFVGESLRCSDNNRPRLVGLITLGASL